MKGLDGTLRLRSVENHSPWRRGGHGVIWIKISRWSLRLAGDFHLLRWAAGPWTRRAGYEVVPWYKAAL